jgi:hypothetical protein
MKEISLTQGKVALVDDCDFEYLNQWNWHYHKRGYAVCNVGGRKRHQLRTMHSMIASRMRLVLITKEVDHKDGNGLNNQRNNLRPATSSQNKMNQKLKINNISGFKGVSWDKENNKWRASIGLNGRNLKLGRFTTPIEAAKVYNTAALEYFGEFARLNPV